MKRRVVISFSLVACLAAYTHQAVVYAQSNATNPSPEKITVTLDGQPVGTPTTQYAYRPAVSGDGRYVAFQSRATNLVAGATNGMMGIYVRDQLAGITSEVSVSSNGDQPNSDSSGASISKDGRYVAFTSTASNLVAGDTNSASDVFIHDRFLHTTRRVSTSSLGAQSTAGCSLAQLSANADFVLMLCSDGNLVANDTNTWPDLFLKNLNSGEVRLVSLHSGDGRTYRSHFAGGSVSEDGRYVVYDEIREVEIYLYDTVTQVTTRISKPYDGSMSQTASFHAKISGNGKFIIYTSLNDNIIPSDTNTYADVFVYDRDLDRTSRVSVNDDGSQRPLPAMYTSINESGRYVAFAAYDDLSGLGQMYVRDLEKGRTALLTGTQTPNTNPDTILPQISADGQYVAYTHIPDIYRVQNTIYEPDLCSTPTVKLTATELASALQDACGDYKSACTSRSFDCVTATLQMLSAEQQIAADLYSETLQACLLSPPSYDAGYSAGFNQGVASVDTSAIRQEGFDAGVASIDQTALRKAGYDEGFAAGAASIDQAALRKASFAAGYASGQVDATAALQPQITDLQSSITTLQNKLSSAQHDNSTLQGQASALQAENSTLKANVAAQQEQVIALQQQVSSLQAQLSTSYDNGYSDGIAVGESATCDPKGNKKITVCKYPSGNPKKRVTVAVALSAVASVLKEGGYIGQCK